MTEKTHQELERIKNAMTSVYIDRLVDQTRMRLKEYTGIYDYAHPSNLITGGKESALSLAQLYQTTPVIALPSGVRGRWLLDKAHDAIINNTIIVVREPHVLVMLDDAYPSHKQHFCLLNNIDEPAFVKFKEEEQLDKKLGTLVFDSYGEVPMTYQEECKFYNAFFKGSNTHLTNVDVIRLL